MPTNLKEAVEDLTPPVVLRLRFMECMLRHYGLFSRFLLVDYFGISAPQASRDIAQYKLLADGNMLYDLKHRRYVISAEFVPLWPSEDAEEE